MGRKLTCMAKDIANGVARRNREQLFFGGWLTTFQLTLSFEASNPCRIAASSTSMFISFRDLNLMQYPLTLALPSVFPYVLAKYVLSLRPRM